MTTTIHLLPTHRISRAIKIRIPGIQPLIILNLDLPFNPIFIDHQRAIPLDQIPLLLIIRRRLRRDNRMFTHRTSLTNLPSCIRTPAILTIRVTRELRIERTTRKLRPIETGRLLRDVVAEADGEHFRSVCGAEVEGVGGVGFAQCAFLEGEDLHDGFLHGFEHLLEGVRFLPGFFGAAVG